MKNKFVLLRIPEDAWDVIWETLMLDSESSAFDSDLRSQIKDALDRVQVVSLEKESGRKR